MEPRVRQLAYLALRGHSTCPSPIALGLTALVIVSCIQTPPKSVSETPPVTAPKNAPQAYRLPAPEQKLTTRMQQPSAPEDGLRIVVSKARRLMTVYQDGRVIHRYQIGLGFHPQGRKRWVGDGRTPEGRYTIALKNPNSRYFLSLGLNYPTPTDALQGYREGRISRQQYRAIQAAYVAGAVPPWNTRLGGEIFIHGHGATRDWTKGCIALDDDDMRELYNQAAVGTPVTILP